MATDLKTYLQEKRSQSPLGLMTHMVAGYPDFATNLKLAKIFEQKKAELLEIQLPFSDPLADGPVIMRANQLALEKGASLKNCLAMIREMSQTVKLPIIIMTYYNLPYRMGLEKFFKQCEKSGASALIVPDILFDEKRESFYDRLDDFSLQPIPVFSPTMDHPRLKQALNYFGKHLKNKPPLIYATLRVGTTGEKNAVDPKGLLLLEKIKRQSATPVAAGFGLSSPKQLSTLKKNAEVAVLGSHLIRLLEQGGLSAVADFIELCSQTLKN